MLKEFILSTQNQAIFTIGKIAGQFRLSCHGGGQPIDSCGFFVLMAYQTFMVYLMPKPSL